MDSIKELYLYEYLKKEFKEFIINSKNHFIIEINTKDYKEINFWYGLDFDNIEDLLNKDYEILTIKRDIKNKELFIQSMDYINNFIDIKIITVN